MQINITALAETDVWPFAHSQAEGGPNAGPETWKAALNGPRPLLNAPEQFAAFRDYVREFGAWDDEEIDGWNENECQALLLQMISGDIREAPAKLDGVEFGEREGEGWFHSNDDWEYESGPFESRSEAYRDACPLREPRAGSLEEIDWEEYQAQSEAGRISSRLWADDGGGYYYDIGN